MLPCTDKKEKKISSYNDLLIIIKIIFIFIYDEIFVHFLIQYWRKPFLIYDFAPEPIWIPYLWGKFWFVRLPLRNICFSIFIFFSITAIPQSIYVLQRTFRHNPELLHSFFFTFLEHVGTLYNFFHLLCNCKEKWNFVFQNYYGDL